MYYITVYVSFLSVYRPRFIYFGHRKSTLFKTRETWSGQVSPTAAWLLVQCSEGLESAMTVSKSSRRRLEVTPLEDFLRSPPAGFSVEKIGSSGLLVRSDPESSLVLIDGIDTGSERVLFQNSLGRWGDTFGYFGPVRVDSGALPSNVSCFSYRSKVKMKNLWEYSSTRKNLLSKRIYLVASSCPERCTKIHCGARGGMIV